MKSTSFQFDLLQVYGSKRLNLYWLDLFSISVNGRDRSLLYLEWNFGYFKYQFLFLKMRHIKLKSENKPA